MTGFGPPPAPDPDRPPQPPPPAYSSAPPVATRAPLDSLSGLATALTVLFGVMALLNLIDAVLHIQLRSRWLELTDDGRFTGTLSELLDVGDLEDRANAFRALSLVGVLATTVVFIIWFFKARRNIDRLGARGGLAAGWAIGGWFIPCANWVLPAIVARDTWRGSSPRARRVSIAPLVVWWAAWAGGGIIETIRRSVEPDEFAIRADYSPLINDYTQARTLSIIAALAWVVAAAFAIVFVRRVGAMQLERVEELRADAAGARLGAAE